MVILKVCVYIIWQFWSVFRAYDSLITSTLLSVLIADEVIQYNTALLYFVNNIYIGACLAALKINKEANIDTWCTLIWKSFILINVKPVIILIKIQQNKKCEIKT